MVLLAKNHHYIDFSEPKKKLFFFVFFWPARVPGGRHRAREAGPDREIPNNTEKKNLAGPGSSPEYGISVLRILLSSVKPC